ncbi:hypothetical protein GW17_00040195 [Ensete ventricosum]|nr:hypothetical protein GW17_00040195 [Ensete ventricosum]
MRLNRVESFNAFTTRTTRRRGWPWLAARGSRLRPRPLARGRLATANLPLQGRSVASKGPLQGGCRPPARGGRDRLPATHQQRTATDGQPARGCPWRTHKGWPPAGTTAPVAGVAAPCQGGYRSQRAAPSPAQG